ncbi:MAG: hypothetical protein J6X10_06070 [Bacteroidales bacterium]|nr:hypothetical protein [Bacteroidales bacterium]
MKKYFKNSIIVICVALILSTLCSTKCRRGPCQHSIKIVNNSDSVVSICHMWHYMDNSCSLGVRDKVKPKEKVEIEMNSRWCLEDLLLSSEPATNYTLYVLPETYSQIHTSYDSLYIVYNVLKTIDLMELGPDSLEKTDYTVYYP